jgi:hypothetical protein
MSVRTTIAAVTVAAAATVLATTTGAVAAPSASSTQVKAISSCKSPQYKPTKYILACGDANAGMKNVAYDWWTTKTAHGTATLYYNDCNPNCAAGHFHFVKAEFTLFHVVQTKKLGPLFDRVSVDTRQGHQIYYLPTSSM